LESFLEGSFIRDEELRDNFFKSNFIKFVIDNHGLMELLNLFKGFTHDRELLCNLSKRLFENKFIIDEYKKYIKKINDYPKDYNDNIDDHSESVEILQYFAPIEAINFYKSVIMTTYSNLFCKKIKNNYLDGNHLRQFIDIDVDPELSKSFLEYDIFLSPITSYPVNDPFMLLFNRPFERLYDDVYICGESDYDIMVWRAYLIYSHFAEILKLGILVLRGETDYWEDLFGQVDTEEEYLEAKKSYFARSLRRDILYKKQNLINLIRELIFYWNVASLRLDHIYIKHKESRNIYPKTKYHLIKDSNGLSEIRIDVIKGDDLTEGYFHQAMTKEDMIVTSLWCGDADPFSNLRFCDSFRELELEEKQIAVEEIASYLEKHLNFE
jgi:hypothetical protein